MHLRAGFHPVELLKLEHKENLLKLNNDASDDLSDTCILL